MKLERPKVIFETAARHIKSHKAEAAQTLFSGAAVIALNLLNVEASEIKGFLTGVSFYSTCRFFGVPRANLFTMTGALILVDMGFAELDSNPTTNFIDTIPKGVGAFTSEALVAGSKLIRKGHQRFIAS